MVEQLQHADILADAGRRPQPGFEVATQLGERRRQGPVAVDRGVIERRRLALQDREKMQGIEHALAAVVAAPMPRNDLAVGHDVDAIDVALNCHHAERPTPWHTVTVAVERGRLVLVHLPGLHHAGIERMTGERQGRRLVLLEADAHGHGVATTRPPPRGATAASQVSVQLGMIVDARDRRGPLPLQVEHAVLDARLLRRGRR